jgi:hypothetical protein
MGTIHALMNLKQSDRDIKWCSLSLRLRPGKATASYFRPCSVLDSNLSQDGVPLKGESVKEETERRREQALKAH